MTAAMALWHIRLEDGLPVPLAGREGDLDVEPILFDVAAAPRDCATNPVPHGVEVQVEFFGREFVARTAAQEDPQRLAHAAVVLVVRREIPEHTYHPMARLDDVAAEQRSRRQPRIGCRNHGRLGPAAGPREPAGRPW